MKKRVSQFTAVVLALIMILSLMIPAFAESSREEVLKKAKRVDSLLETVLDPLMAGVVNCLMKAESPLDRYPDKNGFLSEKQPYFYEGTDGKVTGTGWKMGYASSSVIPLSWRENADGKQDDAGMNLNRTYYFGGYFGSTVNKIYDDETVNLVVLSAGTDSNGNGVEDILIIATLDNIGMSNGNIRKIRQAVSEKLEKFRGDFKEQKGYKPKFTMWAIRAAVTGRLCGADMTAILAILGKEHSLNRAKKCILSNVK